MVWLPFATEESSDVLLSDSTRRKTPRKKKTTPILLSAHDDDRWDDSLESLPSHRGLSSLPVKVGVSDARGDSVVRDGTSEIREPSSPHRFYDEDAAPAVACQDSGVDDLFYDTAIVVKDESKSSDAWSRGEPLSPQWLCDQEALPAESQDSDIGDLSNDSPIIVKDEIQSLDTESRGELICIVRPSSSLSQKEPSDASQSTDEETVHVDTPQDGDELVPKSRALLENHEKSATIRAVERRAIAFGKIVSKATSSYGKRMSKVVSSRLDSLKEKRRKTEEQDKIGSGQHPRMSKVVSSRLDSLKEKRRKTGEQDKIASNQLQSLRSKRKKVAALDQVLDEMEQTKEVPVESEVVSTVPMSSNVRTRVENDGIELNFNGSSMGGKSSDQSLLEASSLPSAAPSDLEKQSVDEASQAPRMKLRVVRPPFTMNARAPCVTPRTIPEPLPSDVESDATKATNTDLTDVSPVWSFIACCSFAVICCNIQDSVLPPTEDVPVPEKNVSLLKKDPSIASSGSDANAQLQSNDNAAQGDTREPISPPKELNVRKSSKESRAVASPPFSSRIASGSKLRIVASESSLAVKSEADGEISQTSTETDLKESSGVMDECKMTASREKETSNEASMQQAKSYVTDTSDALTGLLLMESDTDTTSFDSHDTSLPWWQKVNSVDSSGWNLTYSVDSDGEPGSIIDGIWTVPTVTEYSQASSMISESQFSKLSFESDDELVSVASSSELDDPTESASKESEPIVCDQDIESAKSHDSSAAQANDEQEDACKAPDSSTKDSNDASCESHVNGENQEQKESTSIMKASTSDEYRKRPDDFDRVSVSETEMSVAGSAQCVERKRIRVFSKALSQNVARNIQRRASKMKSKRAARRNEALLVKSGFSVDEELPAIEETNESSNASTTSSLGAETQVTWTKSGIEVDDGTIRSANKAEQQICPPLESASPKSVFDIKLPNEVKATTVPSVRPTSSFDDASNGELEIYMI